MTPITVDCTSCSNSFKVKPAAAGKRIRCPKCKHPNEIQQPEVAAASVPGNGSVDPLAEFNLAMEVPKQQQPTLDIGTDGSEDAKSAPAPEPSMPDRYRPPAMAGHPIPQLPPRREYKFLEALRLLYVVLAGLVAICGLGFFLLAFLGSVFSETEEAGLVAQFIGGLPALFAVVMGVVLMSFAELIKLAMDVQDNTLRAARASESRAND